MAMSAVRIFHWPGQVSFFDVDPRREMSPVAYWRVLQNAAAGHAAALAAATEDLRRGGQTWMLSRMNLAVDRALLLGEMFTVETWPSTRIKGARAYRDYVLKDAAGRVCARASSLWVIVDLATRRPVRIPEAITALSVDPGYDIPALSDALPAPEGGEAVEFRACWSDADQNEHANNAALLRWAVDALPLRFLEQRRLSAVEVHYLAEVAIGDLVRVVSAGEGEVSQEVRRGETVVARMFSQWN